MTPQGLSRKEVSNAYKEFYRTRIGSKSLKRLIETLGEAGLIYEDKDPDDKRFRLIYPLGGGGENYSQIKEEDGNSVETSLNSLAFVSEEAHHD